MGIQQGNNTGENDFRHAGGASYELVGICKGNHVSDYDSYTFDEDYV